MDPDVLAMLLGGMNTGGAMGGNLPPLGVPTSVQPPVPMLPTPPIVPPTPTVGGFPPPQSYEPTNPGNPMMMGPSEAYRSDPSAVAPVPVGRPTSLGASLDPIVPMPQPRPADAPGGTYAAQNATNAQNGLQKDALLNTLKGVTVPKPPEAQKVSTPHAPVVAKATGGNLSDLLASLGIGPQQAFPGLKLPSTLGQALGGK